jgi:ABC-type Mn2+/Zn2+ transport system permease subunit
MSNQFILSLIVGIFVGGAAGYLGSLMITRRMALVGDALGHVALPGMGLALLLHIDPSFGAFAFLLFGILLIWRLGEKTPLSIETLVGIVFVSSLAVGFLIVPEPELLESLIGDISKVSPSMTVISLLLSGIVFWLVRRVYSGIMLLNISEDLAAVEGMARERYNLLYLLAVAMIVSLGVKVTGSLLVGALVILPPAIARMISTNLKQYAYGSIAFGVISNVAGVLIYELTRFPAGPSIILVNSSLFAALLLLKKFAPAGS